MFPFTKTGTLTCPVCGVQHEVSGQTWTKAQELAQTAEAYKNGEAGDQEFYNALQEFEEAAPWVEEPTDPDEVDEDTSEKIKSPGFQ